MDWIAEGTTAMISGMSAVFLILIMISLMIGLLGRVGKLEKRQVKADKPHSQKEEVLSPDGTLDEDAPRRVVAAITIALSKELGMRSDHFVIRKLRRL